MLVPEESLKPPTTCPRGHAWEWDIEEEKMAASPFVFFLRSLKRLVQRTTGFKIMLEFDDPHSAAPAQEPTEE